MYINKWFFFIQNEISSHMSHQQPKNYPIRDLLLKLAEDLPNENEFYAVRYYAGDPRITIIANNLADAYLLYYDYYNPYEYDTLQKTFDDYVLKNKVSKNELTWEWLEMYNANHTLWLNKCDFWLEFHMLKRKLKTI